jgi:hypothetical protein
LTPIFIPIIYPLLIECTQPPSTAAAEPREALGQADARLSAEEVAAVQDYVAEADNLVALRDEIAECDAVLGAVEGLLGRYSADLAATSTDIRALQEQSRAMNVKLRNRRALQGGLSEFVERVALLPSLVHGIMEAPPAGADFAAALRQLDAKLAFVARDEAVRRSAAFRDVAPELERLRLAAVARCRSLLLDQIYALRRPRAHIQAKQAALLRHADAAAFLRRHGGDIYLEVRAAYADKVSGKLLDVFRSYWAGVERLEAVIAGPDDLLGAPDGAATGGVAGVLSMLSAFGAAGSVTSPTKRPPSGASTGLGSFFSGSSTPGPSSSSHTSRRGEPLALGDRASILASLDAPPLILHECEAEGRRFPFEVLFRSLLRLLADIAAHEFLFCVEFWGGQGGDGRAAFREAFAPVTAFVQASLATDVQEVHDPIALLLAIRITREMALAMSRRAVPALDDHLDALNLLLWPRLKSVLDAHIESLKSVAPGDAPAGGDAARVVPLARRYAALTAAVLALHADFVDGPLATTLERMRYNVMNLLLAMSRAFPQRGRGTVFLIHNFSHVVASLKDASARPLPGSASAEGGGDAGIPGLGPAGDEVLAAFEESLSRATSLYVDSRLTAGAPQLVAFVKRGETAAAAAGGDGAPVPGFGPAEAAPVARDFSGRWERIVEVLNREIAGDFGATTAGRTVQQAAFTQLLLLWSRFLELVKRQGEAGAEVARGAVSMPSIMYALKGARLG